MHIWVPILQFIPLRIGKLPNIYPFQLNAYSRSEVPNFLRCSKKRFLFGISKESPLCHIEVAQRLPVDFRKRGLERADI